jgi:anti-sigma regulatory factor (Ser/Thr protein kinase)
VLVVAGTSLNIKLFEHLTSTGWEVKYAENNHAALSDASEQQFDLIVTAEATSAKEDIELLRRIRAVRPHTRMIIVTSESTPKDVIAALKQKAFSYFSPPYSFEALALMIRIAAEAPSWDDGIEVLSGTPDWIRLLVRCDRTCADRMLQFFEELVELPDKERGEVAYAFREMLLNAMRHGARFDPTQYIEISYLRVQRAIACRVKDPGQGFAFDELYHAAISNPIDNPIKHMLYREALGLPPGGYGILVSRHLVDELIHNEQGNEVLLVKYLDHIKDMELH